MASARRTGANESKWSNPGGAGSWQPGVNTFGSAGLSRDYTDIATWESDIDQDLVAAQVSPVLECYRDAAIYTIASDINFIGFVVSSTYFYVIRAAETARHNGVPGAGVVFNQTTGLFYDSQWNVGWYDLELRVTANSASTLAAFGCSSCGYGRFVGLLASGTNDGSGGCHGFTSSSSNYCKWVDCVAHDCDNDGFYLYEWDGRVFNCAAVNNGGYGFNYLYRDGVVYKNCIASGNAIADYNVSGASGTTHNLSGDATAPGATNYRSKTVPFVNAAKGVYLILSTASDARGKGTDLSADSVFAFDDDIRGNTRSAWDLGAHEWDTDRAVAYLAASADDASDAETQYSFNYTGGVLNCVGAANDYDRAGWGMRFAAAIPQGATINAAILRLHSYTGTNLWGTFKGENVDDAASFSATQDLYDRSRTTAGVQWHATLPLDGPVVSPDVKTIVQEIVNRSGWASGNALNLMLLGDTDSVSHQANFYAWDSASTFESILEVEYAVVTGQIARPDSTVLSGNWTATGASSLHAALNDQSDASYATAGTGTDDRMTVGFDSGIVAPGPGTVSLFVRLRRA